MCMFTRVGYIVHYYVNLQNVLSNNVQVYCPWVHLVLRRCYACEAGGLPTNIHARWCGGGGGVGRWVG